MKRLWLAGGLIALLLLLCALHMVRLDRLVGQLTDQLTQAQQLLDQKDWASAEAAAQDAYDAWERSAFYLHITLRHEDIDAIRSSFRELLAFLACREQAAECSAVNARLLNQLELLLEEERPSVQNLL